MADQQGMSNSIYIEGKANFVETTTTKTGKTVTKFSLGNVDRRGSYTYVKTEMWGADQDTLDLLNSGNIVLVRGSLRVNEWENKDGDKRKSTFINAFKVEDATTAQRNRPSNATADKSAPATPRSSEPVASDFGGDDPFASDDPFTA